MSRPVIIMLAAIATALLVRQAILARYPTTQTDNTISISVSQPEQKDIFRPRTARVSKRDDGYFWAKARIGGHYVDFIVDTGAQLVALTTKDAQRININTSNETVDVITASGRTTATRVTIPEIVIDSVRMRDVDALIMGEHLAHSLLGMSFFEHVSGWEAKGDTLIIKQ